MLKTFRIRLSTLTLPQSSFKGELTFGKEKSQFFVSGKEHL